MIISIKIVDSNIEVFAMTAFTAKSWANLKHFREIYNFKHYTFNFVYHNIYFNVVNPLLNELLFKYSWEMKIALHV